VAVREHDPRPDGCPCSGTWSRRLADSCLWNVWAMPVPGPESHPLATRNAWAPVASWFRHRGARVSMVPTTQSADLRAYYSKHAKNDHLDSKLLGLP
jgi:hypothetical protein